MVCSIEGAGGLRRVTEAINQLEADRGVADAGELEARIAAIWSMVSHIDPELARLVSGYRGADLRQRGRRPGGEEAPGPPAGR